MVSRIHARNGTVSKIKYTYLSLLRTEGVLQYVDRHRAREQQLSECFFLNNRQHRRRRSVASALRNPRARRRGVRRRRCDAHQLSSLGRFFENNNI